MGGIRKFTHASSIVGGALIGLSLASPSGRAQRPASGAQASGLELGPFDRDRLLAADQEREAAGGPFRYALPCAVDLDLAAGIAAGEQRVHHRVLAHGARHLNLGFGAFHLPEGATLELWEPRRGERLHRWTAADNDAHGELWTPVYATDALRLELRCPPERRAALRCRLTQVGWGYRALSAASGGAPRAPGSCHVDVRCPEAEDWGAEIPSVGLVSVDGSRLFSGVLLNNLREDFRPFLLTARHCGIVPANAASVVVYWNFENSTCGGPPDGSLLQWQSGATWRASWTRSDCTLVELDDDPDPAWRLCWAGWDASGVEDGATVCIHHPDGVEKRISFDDDAPRVTSYQGTGSPGAGTHLMVESWDRGSTEAGSDGAPLFDESHRVIGQLHGGFALCGNTLQDWFGRFAVSYDGGGRPGENLRSWLDPEHTGRRSVDGLCSVLSLSPTSVSRHQGPRGGPFDPPSRQYRLRNVGDAPLEFAATLGGGVGLELNGGAGPVVGVLPPGGAVSFELRLGAGANALPAGVHREIFRVVDRRQGRVHERIHEVIVDRQRVHSFDLGSDPGWTAEGRWRWGIPAGGGGTEGGNPDPLAGFSGPAVYGFALDGDYRDNLAERHLISPPLDLRGWSNVELHYQRWLNVESDVADHAALSISTDGVDWQTIWRNEGEVADRAWRLCRHDLSAFADDQPTVFLRWTMGPTDDSIAYSGWNLDDLELWAFAAGSLRPYGQGCPGTGGLVPRLSGEGQPSPNGSVELRLDQGLPGARAQLMLALSPDLGGHSCVLIQLPALVRFERSLDAAGSTVVEGTLPPSVPTDVSLFLQGVVVDPGAPDGLAFTNGLELYLR